MRKKKGIFICSVPEHIYDLVKDNAEIPDNSSIGSVHFNDKGGVGLIFNSQYFKRGDEKKPTKFDLYLNQLKKPQYVFSNSLAVVNGETVP